VEKKLKKRSFDTALVGIFPEVTTRKVMYLTTVKYKTPSSPQMGIPQKCRSREK